MKLGFDNDKYLEMQAAHIRERISHFDNKLYLEFGGMLFDDYHASRVLPGFQPDSKLRMLKELADQAEIVIVISAGDIEKNKVRGDLGITYDTDVIRLREAYMNSGLYVGSVVITQYAGQTAADLFKQRLERLGIKVYINYLIQLLKIRPKSYSGLIFNFLIFFTVSLSLLVIICMSSPSSYFCIETLSKINISLIISIIFFSSFSFVFNVM